MSQQGPAYNALMLSDLTYRLKRLDRNLRAKLALHAPRLDALGAPVPLLKHEYVGHRRHDTMLVFLPGIGDLAEDFERHGFIHDLRGHHAAVDAVAVDAHYGYYARRIVLERITEDVMRSIHAAGYDETWLVGASMGGFGAASYAARHEANVNGVLLLAPYLGEKALIEEIRSAGGLAAWEPGTVGPHDYARALWAWFRTQVTDASAGPQIHIGYGRDDMFAAANGLLAQSLPPEQVIEIPGRHDWATWKKIWRAFLARWRQERH